MRARSIIGDREQDDLNQIVADIRARGEGQILPTPSPAAIAAVIAHLRGEKPLNDVELAEREREWHTVEEEMRATETADIQRDRLL